MINTTLQLGILRGDLKVGVVSSIFAQTVRANLIYAGELSGTYIEGCRYGKGEVGEILLIEGQQSIVLGRLIEVKLPERDRGEISVGLKETSKLMLSALYNFLELLILQILELIQESNHILD